MSGIFDRWKLLVFFLACSFAVMVQAEPCDPTPGNEYEKILCQLKRGGRGEGLPSLHDFRKNPPLTQAFLLKKPAERAGISLRIPERANAETVDRQADLLLASAVKPASAPVVRKKPLRDMVITSHQVADPAAACVLRVFELDCKSGRYQLVTNKTNQHLREGALSETNRLNLPAYTGQNRDDFLQQAYSRYLEGMMDIGLGASTMSYTKFVRLYEHISEEKLDFTGRFETMYHFLKEDKANIGVGTMPMIAQGFTSQYCSDVRPGLLACEHHNDNYLFLKTQTP